MIHKMLTIGMMHVRKSTQHILDDDMNFEKYECLTTVKYGKQGWIIHINAKDFETYNKFHQDMPYDLQAVVALAIESGCDTLCISDTERLHLFHLPRYEYVERPNAIGNLSNFEDCYCGGYLLKSVELDEYGREIETGPQVRQMRDYFGKKV